MKGLIFEALCEKVAVRAAQIDESQTHLEVPVFDAFGTDRPALEAARAVVGRGAESKRRSRRERSGTQQGEDGAVEISGEGIFTAVQPNLHRIIPFVVALQRGLL